MSTVLVALGAAGALVAFAAALAAIVGGFRNATGKEAIATQAALIIAQRDEIAMQREENGRCRERLDMMTSDWGKEIGQHVAAAIHVALLPVLDQHDQRIAEHDARIAAIEAERGTR